jgi:hypothetical protein
MESNMKRNNVFLAIMLLLAVMLQPSFAAEPSQERAKPPLPPLPDISIINGVIADTGGAEITPLGVPAAILDELAAFGAPFTDAVLDPSQAVNLIDSKGTLRETLIPVAGLESANLAPTFVTPGAKPKQGMVIGAIYQPGRGAMWVVVTFNNKPTPQPKLIRLYHNPTKYFQQAVKLGTFEDDNGDLQVDPADAGAVISFKRSCITVGLSQVCWVPYSKPVVRESGKPALKVAMTVAKFRTAYKFTTIIDSKTAVPDIIGKTEREACAAYLATATVFTKMTACKANAFIAASTQTIDGQPIGLLFARTDLDVRTYDATGAFVGVLPRGKYLVLDTVAADDNAGTPTALFLVGLDGSTYLIPSRIIEGFGAGAIGNTGQAGIRDGFVRYRLFGW